MSYAHLRSAFAAFCSCAALTVSAVAAPAADDPAPTLVATINGVIDLVLGQPLPAIEAKLPEIRKRMDESFATDVIVQRAFGRNWSKLTPAQQTQMIDLLGRLVIRTYATQLSTGSRPVIAVASSRELSPDRREVATTASRDGKMVNVVYRFGKIDTKWKVYDVLAEGISVVGNYRQQFDAHFEKKSAADLIELLKAKLAAPPEPEKTE